MKDIKNQAQRDPLEEKLAFLEAENKKFQNHWVWNKLGCQPEEFFQVFQKQVESLQIPKDRWEKTLQKVSDTIRIKAKEKRITFNPQNLQLLQGLRV